ncbi:unnamed protein product [Peronospora belbahrii]|uniref:Uncharacterized protein n=1 Tax=Peronospora belbahrii TaxID=622444 RepID=A0ABN8D5H1_9STRA|nr:unnamed protein product [Peronospora belbahrii]CAH0520674.1 unnamed protein product [Peronospora belbahrii]
MKKLLLSYCDHSPLCIGCKTPLLPVSTTDDDKYGTLSFVVLQRIGKEFAADKVNTDTYEDRSYVGSPEFPQLLDIMLIIDTS